MPDPFDLRLDLAFADLIQYIPDLKVDRLFRLSEAREVGHHACATLGT